LVFAFAFSFSQFGFDRALFLSLSPSLLLFWLLPVAGVLVFVFDCVSANGWHKAKTPKVTFKISCFALCFMF